MTSLFPILTADEAATLVNDQDVVSFSGFGHAGDAKAVPLALARRARDLHEKGSPFAMKILTGASSGHVIDEVLAEADAVSFRAPYQSGKPLRTRINAQQVEYVDMHLSHLPQTLAFGFFGKVDYAVVEASEVSPDGRVFLTTGIGCTPTFLKYADKVIIEINTRQSSRLREFADIVVMPRPPHRDPIPITHPLSRIGVPYATVDPKKIVAVVENDEPDNSVAFAPPNEEGLKIAEHLVQFLAEERKKDRIPYDFLPLQAGVGNVANGVMAALGSHPDIPEFFMYSEVFQDSLVDLIETGRLKGASATALTLSADALARVVNNMDFFSDKIVLRPQEISNHPAIIRRLGVIAMNTAIEADIYGNVNSSHIYGMDIMNGIGGSGEFTRNAYLSVFMTPSIAKQGKVSAIVPMCPHIDNNEHSVQVLVTEQGLADLRGLGPMQRARCIIENCAHPLYKDYLYNYLETARPGHISHNLSRCFELHENLLNTGQMLPDLKLS